ncbi:MAG: ABC transporter permease subunit [Ilumatobacter sp.]|uniref:ABC transporter permease n=1 Tax=Ilumatobacter sp. TaxID=1967498 RepID=UPI003C73F11B
MSTTGRMAKRAGLFVVALGLVAVAWEAYKFLGPDDGGDVFGWRIIPKTNDRVMPHVWEMLAEFAEPEVRGKDTPVWQAMLGYAWYTLRMSVAGLLMGATLGMGLAILMARFRIVERGLLPYVVASQTIPLIALAPQVAAIGGNFDLPKWTWAAGLAAFLSFFPVTVATLRGLHAAPAASVELMDSYAASWWTTLRKLRFPAAVPYIVPGMKLAATASVIGIVVSEVSLGLRGVGFAALNYGQKTTSQPATVYTAVFAAAVLGLVMFGGVTAIEAYAMRNRPKELDS